MKPQCDGKTHYIPTSKKSAILSLCDCKPQHTPTPWHVTTSIKEFVPKSQGGGLKVKLMANSESRIGTLNSENPELARANAAYIVKAVNAHEALLKACKAGASMLLRNTLQDAEDTAVYNQMKQAIAQAEGK